MIFLPHQETEFIRFDSDATEVNNRYSFIFSIEDTPKVIAGNLKRNTDTSLDYEIKSFDFTKRIPLSNNIVIKHTHEFLCMCMKPHTTKIWTADSVGKLWVWPDYTSETTMENNDVTQLIQPLTVSSKIINCLHFADLNGDEL